MWEFLWWLFTGEEAIWRSSATSLYSFVQMGHCRLLSSASVDILDEACFTNWIEHYSSTILSGELVSFYDFHQASLSGHCVQNVFQAVYWFVFGSVNCRKTSFSYIWAFSGRRNWDNFISVWLCQRRWYTSFHVQWLCSMSGVSLQKLLPPISQDWSATSPVCALYHLWSLQSYQSLEWTPSW